MEDVKLPQYQCHKKVRAAKIGAIEHTGEPGRWRLDLLMPAELEKEYFGPAWQKLEVDQSWLERFNPVVGGYYVQYEDGYASFSPAKAFEEGYTLIVMTPPANPAP